MRRAFTIPGLKAVDSGGCQWKVGRKSTLPTYRTSAIGVIAVSENGLYVLDSDSKPGPTIMYYDFQTHRFNPVLTLKQDPVAWTANLAASRDGRTLFFTQGEAKSSITMVENFQ